PRRISRLMRPTRNPSRGSQRSISRPRRPAGGPACWNSGSHGPRVCGVGTYRSPSRTKKASLTGGMLWACLVSPATAGLPARLTVGGRSGSFDAAGPLRRSSRERDASPTPEQPGGPSRGSSGARRRSDLVAHRLGGGGGGFGRLQRGDRPAGPRRPRGAGGGGPAAVAARPPAPPQALGGGLPAGRGGL